MALSSFHAPGRSGIRRVLEEIRRLEPWQGTKRLIRRLLEIYRKPLGLEERLRALGVRIGQEVQLQPFTIDERYARLLTIEDRAQIGKGTIIYLSDGTANTVSEDPDPPPVRFGPVRIGKGAVVTRDCIILGGVTIGEYAVVAAGSLVTRDVPPRSVAAGVPARVTGTVDDWIEAKYNDRVMAEDRKHFYIYMPNWRRRQRIGMLPEEQDLYYHENFPKHGY
ncbi:MAG: acyltransferase [bacterium]